MQFTYKALKKDGASQNGTIEANNRDAALQSLVHQGLHPLVVKPLKAKGGGNINIGNFGKKVKSSDMVVFTRQLSTMISAGVPLVRGLTTLQNSPESPYFREVLTKVTKDVESGIPLADAFEKFPRVFDDVYVNMVRAGEEGGILDEILKRLALQVEQDASMRKKIKGAMIYPSVILTVTMLAFFGIMLFIMPQITKIFADVGGGTAALPSYTQALIKVSNFCKSYAVFLVIGAVILVSLVMRYIRTPKGKYRFHSLMLKTPIIKTIITKVAIARFSRTFSSLMGAGVGVLQALNITGGAIGNKVIEKELKAAAEQVKAGQQLSVVIAESKNFPKIVPEMLAVGEETGQIDVVLVKVAEFYEEEVKTTIDSLTSIIEPVMIIILGAGVGLIAASVMGPIANLSKSISPNS